MVHHADAVDMELWSDVELLHAGSAVEWVGQP
jgi:hypothetical protein